MADHLVAPSGIGLAMLQRELTDDQVYLLPTNALEAIRNSQAETWVCAIRCSFSDIILVITLDQFANNDQLWMLGFSDRPSDPELTPDISIGGRLADFSWRYLRDGLNRTLG